MRAKIDILNKSTDPKESAEILRKARDAKHYDILTSMDKLKADGGVVYIHQSWQDSGPDGSYYRYSCDSIQAVCNMISIRKS